MLLKCILALSFAVVVCGQLVQIVAHTRLEGSNFIQLECRETFQNGSRATVLNTQLLLFNETGEYVTSLLDREGVTHEFSERGIFSFDIDQRIEGYYYCSRDPGAGIPALAITLLAIPRKEEVPEYYERHVGESVTLRSGVGEGALAAHYTASFYKTTSNEITELTTVSRGEDFSLTISSLQLSDSGTYEPSVSITTMNGDIFYYLRNPSTITLTVYKSPIIEVAPTPIVDNEGAESVSFTCIASGGPFLRLFWFREDKNLTNYTPSQYSITNTTMNGGTKMRSVVTVHTPGFNESGRFKCVATIMDGRDGDAFKAEESADLTILESDFYLKTIITEHKQVQLWVELKNPISLYPVTAIVYFRSTANPSQEPQQVQTHSIITSTTVMVFQLEQHDVPDKFQDENFYIQVALRVDSVYSPQVPKSLDAATTASKIESL
ncbi:hypothetical protein GBAR_LOCUS31444 [Geodia barretti]|uniref:Ig-like domain-containing protein n=1 Tax=Geodia barretti TaxID=519541 RepID=A0AA35U319_GEOBA|nr:hypothetical protein GBAR_LOCUS31444 [Geodia barretti]